MSEGPATCCSTSTGRAPSSCRRRWVADVVSIFILPPTMAELQSRLHRRAEDTEEVIARRVSPIPRSEIEHWLEYDYIVVNEDLDSAFASVKAIVEAERLRAATAAPDCSNSSTGFAGRKRQNFDLGEAGRG